MSDRDNSGSVLAAFLAGGAIGAALGILFAPRAGEETRQDLTQRAQSLLDQAQAASQKAMQAAEDAVEAGKGLLEKEKDAVTKAAKAGKKAWEKNRG